MKYRYPSCTGITHVLQTYLLLYKIHPMNRTSFKYKLQSTKLIWLSLLYEKSGRLSTKTWV